jgi:hypothetical protein
LACCMALMIYEVYIAHLGVVYGSRSMGTIILSM